MLTLVHASWIDWISDTRSQDTLVCTAWYGAWIIGLFHALCLFMLAVLRSLRPSEALHAFHHVLLLWRLPLILISPELIVEGHLS